MGNRTFNIYIILSLLIIGNLLQAGITYNRESRTVTVVNFPEKNPCRPENILRADRIKDWGIMRYDKASDCYELNANLCIGSNNNTCTYFQIGREKNLNEILKIKGNLIIYPEYVKGENKSKVRNWINCLTVGVQGNKDSKACLRIVNGEKTRHSIYISRIPKPGGGYLHKPYTAFGGSLKVYNAAVGGIGPEPREFMGAPLLYGRKIVFENAVIENFRGCFTSGCFPRITEIRGTVFRNGGCAVRNPGFNMQNCEFEKLKAAVAGYSDSIRITLKNCIFKDNIRNFLIHFRGSMIELVDCKVGKAKYPDVFRNVGRGKKELPPALLLRRKNQKILVSSPDGKPLAGINILILPNDTDANSGIYSNVGTTITTDKDGQAATLLVISSTSLPEGRKTPQTRSYEYRIEASGKKYPEKIIKAFKPNIEPDVLSIKMKGK